MALRVKRICKSSEVAGFAMNRFVAVTAFLWPIVSCAAVDPAPSLPKDLGFGFSSIWNNSNAANQVYADLHSLRLSLKDTTFDDVLKNRANTLISDAEGKGQKLCVDRFKASSDDRSRIDEQASDVRKRFDVQIARLLTAGQVTEWADCDISRFEWETGLVFGTDPIETSAKMADVILDAKQMEELKSIEEDLLRKSFDRLHRKTATEAQELDKDAYVLYIEKTLERVRKILTVEQCKKIDHFEVSQFRVMLPSTRPR